MTLQKRLSSTSSPNGTENDDRPKKKAKSDFTEIEFKVMTRDPNTKFTGIQTRSFSKDN